MTSAVDLYLDLLMRSLTRARQEDNDVLLGFNDWTRPPTLKRRAADVIASGAGGFGYEIVKKMPYEAELRERGHDWPARAETMIGLKRMANIRMTVESVLADGVPGDLVETGVWREEPASSCGASSRPTTSPTAPYGRAILRGATSARPDALPAMWSTTITSTLEPRRRSGAGEARLPPISATRRSRCGSSRVCTGHIRRQRRSTQTCCTPARRRHARCRPWQALEPLYPKVSPGGLCIVDDYYLPNWPSRSGRLEITAGVNGRDGADRPGVGVFGARVDDRGGPRPLRLTRSAAELVDQGDDIGDGVDDPGRPVREGLDHLAAGSTR